jgi:phosphoribosylglycinamide formyltransferase 1
MEYIAIFASGSGSNALQIINHFAHHPKIRVALVVSNKADAGVLDKARKLGIQTLIISKSTFYETQEILKQLDTFKISFIALAGFLWLVPQYVTEQFSQRIVNIHPALLPKFGGKGMYGLHVHKAVKAAGETESGITIHYADRHYDEGAVIFQAKCPVFSADTPEEIAARVLTLEHQYFPQVIEKLLS